MSDIKPRALSADDAAKYLGLSPQDLTAIRCRRKGPAYRTMHGRIIYEIAELDRYLESRDRFLDGEGVAS